MTAAGPGRERIALFVLALAVRLAFALATGKLHEFPGECDEVLYDAPARVLAAEGRLVVSGEHPVGQTLLSALVYRLAGPSTEAARTAAVGLSAATVVLVRELASLVLPGPWPGACGLLAAFHPWLVYRAATVQTEVSALALGCAVFLVAAGAGPAGPGLTAFHGVLVGLWLLVRPSSLALIPALVAFGVLGGRGRSARDLLLAIGLGGLLFAPWVAYTSRQAGHFALGMGRSWDALYGSNCDVVWQDPHLRGVWTEAPGPPVGEPGWFQKGFGERERILRPLAMAWIRAHPGEFAALGACKLGRLFSLYRPFEGAGRATRAAVVELWVVLGLAALGARSAWRSRRREWVPWLLWAAGVVGPCLVFHGANRFRYVLEPVLLVLAIEGIRTRGRSAGSRPGAGPASPAATPARMPITQFT